MAPQASSDELASYIRAGRARLRLTQEEAARRAALSVATWRSIEQGQTPSPRLGTLVAIAEVLELPVREITERAPRGDLPAAERLSRIARTTRSADVVELAVVGYGACGSKHVRVFASMPDVSVTVVDRDQLRLAEAKRAYPTVNVNDRLDPAFETAEVVVIATPPRSHAPIAHAAIRAGCHVLIEEPLATSVAECEELIDAAMLAGVQLMVGHTFEDNAAIWKLRDIANSGELGEIRYIDCARLNLGLFQQDVNVIWDLAPHDVSIINFILGRPPTAVSAWGHSHANRGLEDVAHIQLRYAETGVRAYLHVSWLDPCKVRRVTIVGSDKMAVYDGMATEGTIRIYDVGLEERPIDQATPAYRRLEVVEPATALNEPLAEQAKQVLHSVRTGDFPRADGQSGLAVARVLEAADRALRSGAEVLLDKEPAMDVTIESMSQAAS